MEVWRAPRAAGETEAVVVACVEVEVEEDED
jgi:hypothetical protein